MIQVVREVTQNGLILAFRFGSILFLIAYPLVKLTWRMVNRPWFMGSMSQGLSLTFAPLRHLSTRLYDTSQQLPEREVLSLPAPAPDPSKSDLNDATVEELRVVEGIGFVKALEIVEYRERYGHYRRIEELGMIPGIGAKTLHVLAERFEVKQGESP